MRPASTLAKGTRVASRARIGFAVVLVVSLTLVPLGIEAQQSGKPSRIGVLFLGLSSTLGVRAEIVRESCQSSATSTDRTDRSVKGNQI
jgi:hypothetical protein